VELAGQDADTGIFYLEAQHMAAGGGAFGEGCLEDTDTNLSFAGEFDGVAYDIDQDLSEALAVGEDAGGDVFFDLGVKEDAGGEGPGSEDLEDAFHAGAQVDGSFFEVDLSRLHGGEVEYIIDNGQEGIAATSDGIYVTALFFIEGGGVEEGGHTHYSVHGSADLVGHICEEEAFGAEGFIGEAGLLICLQRELGRAGPEAADRQQAADQNGGSRTNGYPCGYIHEGMPGVGEEK
jgi:hypothetical protein